MKKKSKLTVVTSLSEYSSFFFFFSPSLHLTESGNFLKSRTTLMSAGRPVVPSRTTIIDGRRPELVLKVSPTFRRRGKSESIPRPCKFVESGND
jgi:hypothetical protein